MPGSLTPSIHKFLSVIPWSLTHPLEHTLAGKRGMQLWQLNQFEAHQRLGLETIKCRVRKATPQTLKMHMM
eukprot:scaffold115028_cov20-Tisochrysis_lutea.AAC.1